MTIMKKGLHPQYFPKAKVSCACGNTFTVGSTLESLNVEICYNCHPFYTGKDKLIDTAGRVDRFKKIVSKKAPASDSRRVKKVKKANQAARKAAAKKAEPKSILKAAKVGR